MMGIFQALIFPILHMVQIGLQKERRPFYQRLHIGDINTVVT